MIPHHRAISLAHRNSGLNANNIGNVIPKDGLSRLPLEISDEKYLNISKRTQQPISEKIRFWGVPKIRSVTAPGHSHRANLRLASLQPATILDKVEEEDEEDQEECEEYQHHSGIGLLQRQRHYYNQHKGLSIPNVIPTQIHAMFDRVLYLRGVDANIGLNCFLSQVCGGPLEKVILRSAGSFHNTVELHYLNEANALSFYDYSRTGRFMVNGKSCYPTWGSGASIPLSKAVEQEMTENGARRCITLKHVRKLETTDRLHRTINGASALRYNVKLDFDLLEIQKDFQAFGDIINIMPLISSQVTVSVQYANVRSAIRARRAFQRKVRTTLTQVKLYQNLTVG